ncbi:MAG: histidinol-phosphatase [Bacteroidales bacterium]|nr:histidinol-phosphatase [Bacteroidales bacterium]MDD4821765.1 histidinol-phosphatase [Bacteroidales bacterium]
MYLTNYHSHCSFCDGRAPMEDFIIQAIKMGFTSYGISSHAPLPFHRRWAMEKSEVSAYLSEFCFLKEKYSNQIDLYVGMEIDYLDEDSNPSNTYFQSLPLDYRIGSVHLLHGVEGEIVDIDGYREGFKDNLIKYLGGELKPVIQTYFDKMMRMIDGGGIDFVGHCDKIFYNALFVCPDLLEKEWYNRLMEEYYDFIAERGMMIELNTKAFDETGFFFPNTKYLPMIRDRKIPVLVNSDAHYPDRINSGLSSGYEALLHCGFREVVQRKGSSWQLKPLYPH